MGDAEEGGMQSEIGGGWSGRRSGVTLVLQGALTAGEGRQSLDWCGLHWRERGGNPWTSVGCIGERGEAVLGLVGVALAGEGR